MTFGADARGVFPEVGDYVAYNYSGDIATGLIQKIGRTKTGRKIYTIFQIAPDKGHMSVVRGGARCILVLRRDGEILP